MLRPKLLNQSHKQSFSQRRMWGAGRGLMAVRHAARLRAIRQEATPNLKWSSHAVTFLPVTRFDCPSPPRRRASACRPSPCVAKRRPRPRPRPCAGSEEKRSVRRDEIVCSHFGMTITAQITPNSCQTAGGRVGDSGPTSLPRPGQ